MRARAWLLGACGALVACRGVLGIEELELVDAGEDAAGASDAATQAEAANDSGLDAPAPVDAGMDSPFASCGAQGANCPMCCHDNVTMAAFIALDEYGVDAGCICGSGSCPPSQCASVCANPSSPPNCGMCTDPVFAGSACPAVGNACANDPSCAAAIECLRICFP
jgi:hypothetical protein